MGKVHEVRNFKGFVEDLKSRDVGRVLIGAGRHLPGGATVAIGGYGEFVHDLFYSAHTAKKERSYHEILFTLGNQAHRAWNSAAEASIATSTGLVVLAAEARLEMLRSALPDAEVDIEDPNNHGEPIAADVLEHAHEQAIQAGATEAVSRLFLAP